MTGRSEIADYAPTKPVGSDSGAVISAVELGSPAHRAGIVPGAILLMVEGQPLIDIVDWLWLSDGFAVDLVYKYEGTTFTQSLTREQGEFWGISFKDPLFDGVRICRNNCLFCFMSMLPKGMRSALYVRDDDYRLSFLQGNFVTLTNMDQADVDRVKLMRLSPLHVSLHAVSPHVRECLMGRNQARGLAVLEELLAADIKVHAQIVLVPGYNDGEELDRTLSWIEQQPGILSVGIVPYGYTRFAKLQTSYEDHEAARAVLSQIEPYQLRSRELLGVTRFQPSDEFYCNAFPADIERHLPPAELYDGFPQYEDGIGMLRVFADDWRSAMEEIELLAGDTAAVSGSYIMACGTAFERFFTPLLASSPLAGKLVPLAVENRYFGGVIDVSGLLAAADVCEQLAGAVKDCEAVLLPQSMFNADGMTLDGCSVAEIAESLSARVSVVPCNVESLLAEIAGI